ncbi:hypothetical protein ACKA06_17925 [Rossellomorea oryzaecorticis]|jgi:LPS O-antigen subunit length determinant protein (WzzB/FepE family)|uniref:Uncharacterized protein n=1 Tax=Rossellomorea oryzaecorticis TaxID=1396505 RepID=A0ABW8VUL2_9BACI|nr:hypothetical protein KJK41_12725 [Bacillus haikouensis]
MLKLRKKRISLKSSAHYSELNDSGKEVSKRNTIKEVFDVLWWILGISAVFAVVSAMIRGRNRKSSFDVSNEHERQIQEEERVKAGSWFNGGNQ